MATITRRTGVAIWSQIEQHLADEIDAGRLRPGSQLPREAELALNFGVNKHTVRRALASLEQRGLVRIEHGRGSFVQEGAIDYLLGKRTRFLENLSAAGVQGKRTFVQSSEIPADDHVAAALRLKAGAPVTFVRTLGEAKGHVISVAEHYFPAARFRGIDELIKRHGSTTTALKAMGVADYTRLETRITARLPEPEIAELLKLPGTRPVLSLETITIDQAQKPLDFAHTYFAGDLVQLVWKPDA